MKIALVAWNSVVWNPKKLSIHSFKKNGPVLPLEYSRIQRNGQLALIIDERNGAENAVQWTTFRTKNLDTAIDQFINRTGLPESRVGVLNVKTGQVSAEARRRHPRSVDAIRNWARKNKIDAVIWSDLGMKFRTKVGTRFSPEAAQAYFNRLDPKLRRKTVIYINKALDMGIKTPSFN